MGNRTWSRIMSMALVVLSILVLLLPTTSYALFPRYYPVIRTAPGSGGGGSSGVGNSGGSYSGYHGPIYQPQMHYAPEGGGGGGTSTFSTPSGNGNGNGQPQAVVTEYSNGVVIQSTGSGAVGHGGVHVPVKSTTSQSTTSGQSTNTQVITITKTYTQYVYYTTVINNVITKYMYPIIQWTLTYINIGQYQQPGYHAISSEKLFTPGYGGNGIFVPVFAQEAVYSFNYAPSVKPQVTGWYVGSQSQYSTASTSKSTTPPQLSSVQQYVDNAQQAVNAINQLATTNPKGLASTTYVYYSSTLFQTITQPGQNNTNIIIEWPLPYFYGTKDFVNTSYTAGVYAQQAFNDLTHGNIASGLKNLLNVQASTAKFGYMLAWDDFAIPTYIVSSIVTTPLTPWSIAHALKAGVNAVENAVGTVVNFFSHL
jgi:hypothetical protein